MSMHLISLEDAPRLQVTAKFYMLPGIKAEGMCMPAQILRVAFGIKLAIMTGNMVMPTCLLMMTAGFICIGGGHRPHYQSEK